MRIWLAFLLLPGVALAHEGHEPLPSKGASVQQNRLMLSASAAKAIGVQLGKVTLADTRRTVQAVGSLELPWSQQAYVSTLFDGRVEQVLVKPGESVAEGQVLARISGAELESLQLEMLQAVTEKAWAERLLKGQESAGEGIAGKVLLQTRTEVRQQCARFHAAWQKLRAIGLDSGQLQQICDSRQTVATIALVSPIPGTVATAAVRTGQMVQPAKPLFQIVDLRRLWIVGRVLEADVGQVKIGQPVEISFATLGEMLSSRIEHIDLRLNPDRTLSVKAFLDNPAGKLKPGMFGRLLIERSSSKAVVCPAEALNVDGPRTYALVEHSAGKFVRKSVVVAAVRGRLAEIEDGLFPGDRVVTVGSHELLSLFPTSPRQATESLAPLRGITAQGQIELPVDQKTFASAPIDGLVRRILVEHGERVAKGDVLAELESLPFKTLQLDFLRARTSLAQAELNLERAQPLRDSLAKKDLWQLQSQFDTSQQTVASLRRQLQLVGLSESELKAIEETDLADLPGDLSAVLPIRAQADGLVGDFDLARGQFVAHNAQLFELHNPQRVWVRAFLFEQDARHIRPGQGVRVGLASDPAFRAVGRIERLDPLLSSGNRALAIWTELDNPGLQLKEGMAAILTLGQPDHAELAD